MEQYIADALPADQVAFDGIRLSVLRSNLKEESFQTLAAGEAVEAEWDPAEVHDLSTGGEFGFLVRGAFLTAEADSTDISGAVPFDSNAFTSHIDGVAAAKVRRNFHEKLKARRKRTTVENDCTGARGSAQRTALTNCARLATAAAGAASNGSTAKLSEYFKSSSSQTRTTVAGIFRSIATECDSTTSGISEQYCTDVLDSCVPADSVLAYTLPSQDLMVSCPLYFQQLDALTQGCHQQDQATTTLHETTHLRQIRGTNDYGYGYQAIQQLSAAQSLNNADTYAQFANGTRCF